MAGGKILIDSSWLIAQYDKRSRAYEEIREISKYLRGHLVVPQVVLTEATYLLNREMGTRGVIKFLEEFNETEPLLQEVTVPDLRRVKDILQQYTTAKFDFVDCCLMALSERLNISQVGTLDRRDFTIFRPRHVSHFKIRP
jgi:predicted nucleic acid-binding protein